MTITKQEVEALLKAVDSAIREGGLDAAVVFLPIVEKLINLIDKEV